MNIKVIKHF